MKKIFLSLFTFCFIFGYNQFKINIQLDPHFEENEAFVFTFSGSKEILYSKVKKKNNNFEVHFDKEYIGMMKMYLPTLNYAFNFISENKNIQIQLKSKNPTTVSEIIYLDSSNQLMENILDIQKKREYILPVLLQIKDYYNSKSVFENSLNKEIERLSDSVKINSEINPFIYFYHTNYNKFLVQDTTLSTPKVSDYENFLINSGYLLENSTLLRPILVNYLNAFPPIDVESNVESFLQKLDVSTPRGQIVLAELIDIFDAYSMQTLKEKFLNQANNLKCSIIPRLEQTIKANYNTKIGNIFPNYKFNNPNQYKLKSIYDIKSNIKVVMFWASSCTHCEKELPVILKAYSKMKQIGIEVIGISLDTKFEEYKTKIEALPWINDTELRGWNSSFVETYNLQSTPTYYILDHSNKIIAKPSHAKDVLQFLKIE